jgi:hypothetical protein
MTNDGMSTRAQPTHAEADEGVIVTAPLLIAVHLPAADRHRPDGRQPEVLGTNSEST